MGNYRKDESTSFDDCSLVINDYYYYVFTKDDYELYLLEILLQHFYNEEEILEVPLAMAEQ